MVTSLVSVEEFAGYLRTSFDAEDAYSAQQYLDDATATILDEIGQPLALSTDTVVRDGTGTCDLVLPRHPVTAISEVKVLDPDADATKDEVLMFGSSGYRWSAAGILTRTGGVWPARPRAVRVVYTPGWATIPEVPKRICRRLAASAWHNPAGATEEADGDHRVRWHGPGGELTTAEKRQLDPYRVR